MPINQQKFLIDKYKMFKRMTVLMQTTLWIMVYIYLGNTITNEEIDFVCDVIKKSLNNFLK